MSPRGPMQLSGHGAPTGYHSHSLAFASLLRLHAQPLISAITTMNRRMNEVNVKGHLGEPSVRRKMPMTGTVNYPQALLVFSFHG